MNRSHGFWSNSRCQASLTGRGDGILMFPAFHVRDRGNLGMELWKPLLVVSICLVALPLAPASSVVLREPYEGPAVLAYGGVSDCDDPARSMGVGCFDVPVEASRLEIRVRDRTDLPIGGAYYLSDAAGEFAGSGSFCGSASLLLDGAATTAVIRLEAVNGPLACIDQGEEAPGLATRGIVAIRLT